MNDDNPIARIIKSNPDDFMRMVEDCIFKPLRDKSGSTAPRWKADELKLLVNRDG